MWGRGGGGEVMCRVGFLFLLVDWVGWFVGWF